MRTLGYLFGRFPRGFPAFVISLVVALGKHKDPNDFMVYLILNWLGWYLIFLAIGAIKKGFDKGRKEA